MLTTLAMGACAASRPAGASSPRLLVITASGAPAYSDAVEGLRTVLPGNAALTIIALSSAEVESARAALLSKPDLVIAVGSSALEMVVAAKSAVPVVATMVLGGEPGPDHGSVVTLDLPVAEVLSRVKEMLPDRKRVAVLRGSAVTPADATEIQSQARKLGLELTFIRCAGPKDALDSPSLLRGKADLLWCLPDRSLFQPPMVSALTLGSIRNGLALIGFSEGIVRAGALIGFYPDYRDVGRQTGESALRMLAQGPPMRERPRRVVTAVNERVARVLGISFRRRAESDIVTVQ